MHNTSLFISHSFPFSFLNLTYTVASVTLSSPFQFFHFSSRAFLPPDGQFAGRVRWQGSPARGEAAISLINATLNDNGTYTCSVRNPPDVHGSPTSHTVLTVTPKGKIAPSSSHNVRILCLQIKLCTFDFLDSHDPTQGPFLIYNHIYPLKHVILNPFQQLS